MVWLQIQANIAEHKKFDKAGPVAAWLWLAGVGYCRINETDGFIRKGIVAALVPGLAGNGAFRAAAKLVEVKLWHEDLGGYRVNDYHEWNPSKEELESKRKADRLRKDSKRNPNGIQEPPVHEGTGAHALGRPPSPSESPSGVDVLEGESAREPDDLSDVSPIPPGWSQPRQRPVGLIDGRAQRRHAAGNHAMCFPDRGLCVTQWVHDELVGKRGGNRAEADAWLRAWYPQVIWQLGDGPVGDRVDDFWRNAFAAEVGTVTQRPSGQALSKGQMNSEAFDQAANFIEDRRR